MKFASLLFMFLFTAATLSACNTTRGFGEDVEAVGDSIKNAAEEAQDDIDD